MHCPGCGLDIEGLEERCREEFNLIHGQHFHNLEVMRGHRGYWHGAWIGVAIDFLMLCFIFGIGGWSWDGFLEIVHRAFGKSYFLVFMPVIMPIVTAIAGSKFASDGVEVEKEQAYQKFREMWSGCQNTEE